jgi:hypothetical protein
VVDLHFQGDGDVDAAVDHELGEAFRDVFRDVQWSCLAAVVADADGVVADAEWRHELVEEAVVVVGSEVDDDVRVVVVDEAAGSLEGGLDLGFDCGSWVPVFKQGAVGHG